MATLRVLKVDRRRVLLVRVQIEGDAGKQSTNEKKKKKKRNKKRKADGGSGGGGGDAASAAGRTVTIKVDVDTTVSGCKRTLLQHLVSLDSRYDVLDDAQCTLHCFPLDKTGAPKYTMPTAKQRKKGVMAADALLLRALGCLPLKRVKGKITPETWKVLEAKAARHHIVLYAPLSPITGRPVSIRTDEQTAALFRPTPTVPAADGGGGGGGGENAAGQKNKIKKKKKKKRDKGKGKVDDSGDGNATTAPTTTTHNGGGGGAEEPDFADDDALIGGKKKRRFAGMSIFGRPKVSATSTGEARGNVDMSALSNRDNPYAGFQSDESMVETLDNHNRHEQLSARVRLLEIQKSGPAKMSPRQVATKRALRESVDEYRREREKLKAARDEKTRLQQIEEKQRAILRRRGAMPFACASLTPRSPPNSLVKSVVASKGTGDGVVVVAKNEDGMGIAATAENGYSDDTVVFDIHLRGAEVLEVRVGPEVQQVGHLWQEVCNVLEMQYWSRFCFALYASGPDFEYELQPSDSVWDIFERWAERRTVAMQSHGGGGGGGHTPVAASMVREASAYQSAREGSDRSGEDGARQQFYRRQLQQRQHEERRLQDGGGAASSERMGGECVVLFKPRILLPIFIERHLSDDASMSLLQLECMHCLLHGLFPYTLEDVVHLTGLQLQLDFGDQFSHSSSVTRLDSMRSQYFPYSLLDASVDERLIQMIIEASCEEHARHKGRPNYYCNLSYVSFCRQKYMDYGATFVAGRFVGYHKDNERADAVDSDDDLPPTLRAAISDITREDMDAVRRSSDPLAAVGILPRQELVFGVNLVGVHLLSAQRRCMFTLAFEDVLEWTANYAAHTLSLKVTFHGLSGATHLVIESLHVERLLALLNQASHLRREYAKPRRG